MLLRPRQSLRSDPCPSHLDSIARWLSSSRYAHFVNAQNVSFRKTTSLPNKCNSSVKIPDKPLCGWNRETWPRGTGSLHPVKNKCLMAAHTLGRLKLPGLGSRSTAGRMGPTFTRLWTLLEGGSLLTASSPGISQAPSLYFPISVDNRR